MAKRIATKKVFVYVYIVLFFLGAIFLLPFRSIVLAAEPNNADTQIDQASNLATKSNSISNQSSGITDGARTNINQVSGITDGVEPRTYQINNSATRANTLTYQVNNSATSTYAQATRAGDSAGRIKVQFVYNGQKFNFVDTVIKPSNHAVAADLFERKHMGTMLDKINVISRKLGDNCSFEEAVTYAFPHITKTIERIQSAVNTPPQDSVIKFNPDVFPMFQLQREKSGFRLDRESLFRDMFACFEREYFNSKFVVAVKPTEVKPSITIEDTVKCTNLISRFSTNFSASIDERKHNIALALQKINGRRINPSEEFSFNKIVGRRTLANGFLEAMIINNGKYVKGVGGGVCQASTTIYNASIRAGMSIAKVRNHSLVAGYVPPSMDAMVNSYSSDLIFVNPFSTPVFVRSYVSCDNAIVEFYGATLPYTIKLESVVKKEIKAVDEEFIDTKREYFDLNSITGEKMRIQEAKNGLQSQCFVLYYDSNNRLIEKKLIREDVYISQNGRVAICP